LVFEILVDPHKFPIASHAALWIEAFFSGDIHGDALDRNIYVSDCSVDSGFILLLTGHTSSLMNISRPVPYVINNSNISVGECSIPDGTIVSAAFILLLSVACILLWV
jgi:hypothetical protein